MLMFLSLTGPPGPPGIRSSSSSCHLQRRHYNGLDSGDCPFSVESQSKLLESSHDTLIEAGTLVFLKEENKMVLKTSEGWLELQVYF